MILPFRKTLMAAVVALALPGAALAQQQSQQPQQQNTQAAQPQNTQGAQQQQRDLSQVRASDLEDMKVVDAQGRDIGEISEVVVDLQSGRIHAAVIEFGGVLGIGDKQFAFAPDEIKPGRERDQLVLNVDKEQLENREGFSKDQWPAMGDDYWGRVGGKASAGAGKPQEGKPANLMRASELSGKDVHDNAGRDVGEIRDVVLDLRQGEVRTVEVDVDGGGRANLEPKSLTRGTGDRLVADMSADELRSQAEKSDRQAQQRDDNASAGGSRPRGNGDVGVLGPERPGEDPVGGAHTGARGTDARGQPIGPDSQRR